MHERTNDVATLEKPAATLAALERVTFGSVGISAPKTAIVDEQFTVELKAGVAQLDTILADLAREVPENATRSGKEGVKLTPRMSASLSGLGFDITPQGSIGQAVMTTEPTTWQWQVKAKQPGTLSLNFTLSQTVMVEGKEVLLHHSFRQILLVDVKPFDIRDFTANNWQWFITILLLPLGKFAWDTVKTSKAAVAAEKTHPVAKLRDRLRHMTRR